MHITLKYDFKDIAESHPNFVTEMQSLCQKRQVLLSREAFNVKPSLRQRALEH